MVTKGFLTVQRFYCKMARNLNFSLHSSVILWQLSRIPCRIFLSRYICFRILRRGDCVFWICGPKTVRVNQDWFTVVTATAVAFAGKWRPKLLMRCPTDGANLNGQRVPGLIPRYVGVSAITLPGGFKLRMAVIRQSSVRRILIQHDSCTSPVLVLYVQATSHLHLIHIDALSVLWRMQ